MTSFDGGKKLYYWKSARRLVDYIHLKKFTEMGGANVVRSYQELAAELKKYIETPDHDLERRRYALRRECHQNDGESTMRVIEALELILENMRTIHV